MKSCLLTFQKGLSDLQQYVEGLNFEKQLIPPTGDLTSKWTNLYKGYYDHHAANYSLKKRYNYNSIIVSMYGLVEQYIKELMHDYLESLQKIVPTYSHLPEPIIKNHVTASFELIKQTEQNRYRGSNSKDKIISKLNSCLNDPENYKLNFDAFCQHNANFRSDVIDKFFNNVGISNIMQQALKNANFEIFLKDMDLSKLHENIEKNVDQRKKEERTKILQERAFYYLNDLADRRNDVAHGIASELLDTEILLDYLAFLNVFGNTIYDVLLQYLMQKENGFLGVKIGKPTNAYKEGVFCILSNHVHIKKNDYIVGQKDKEFVTGKILEIQIGGTEENEVPEETSIEIGIRTNCKIKKTHKISIISHEKKIL